MDVRKKTTQKKKNEKKAIGWNKPYFLIMVVVVCIVSVFLLTSQKTSWNLHEAYESFCVDLVLKIHAPADEKSESLESTIVHATEETKVEKQESTFVPAFVKEEAARVAESALDKQGSNSMTFLLGSDMHVMGDGERSFALMDQSRESNLHAGQAMALIAEQVKLDFMAVLGDIATDSPSPTIEQNMQALELAKEYLADARSKVKESVIIPGNHDEIVTDTSIFSGYHYRDYEEKKVRIIFLNTADGGSENISAEQLQWFAETLDLSEKEDAADWGIMIFSHHPLDWGNIVHAAWVLNAYLEGSDLSMSHNDSNVAYDFTGKNAATVIAQFHGHIHNFKVDNIHYVSDYIATPTSVQRIAIPNICARRTNYYGQDGTKEYYGMDFGDSETYDKIPGSAQDTSFCVVTLDLDAQRIYVDHYGAGIDRVVDYEKQMMAEETTNSETTVSMENE